MIKLAVFCQVLCLLVTFSIKTYGSDGQNPDGQQPPSLCGSVLAAPRPKVVPITTKGLVKTFKTVEEDSSLYLHIGSDKFVLRVDQDGNPQLNPKTSLYAPAADIPVFHTQLERGLPSTVIKSTGLNDLGLVNNTKHIFFIVHPKLGLIVVEESGVVFRLPEEIASLKADQIQTILIFSELMEDHGQILVTKDGRAFHLRFNDKSGWDGWPEVEFSTSFAFGGPDLNDIEGYVFFGLSMGRLGLEKWNYQLRREEGEIQGYVRKTLEQGPPLGIEGNVKTLTRLSDSNHRVFVFAGQKSRIGVWDAYRNTFLFKTLVTDNVSVQDDVGVRAIFDLPHTNQIAVITTDGHIRTINRGTLLDPRERVAQFMSVQPAFRESFFPAYWKILRTRIIDLSKGIFEIVVTNIAVGSSEVRTYHLNLLSTDAGKVLQLKETIKDMKKLQPGPTIIEEEP